MTMQRIPQMCVSDMYGALSTDVPEHVFTKIREILTILYNHRVYYPDITGYNFIEYGGHVWIIDFGHAYISDKFKDSFVLEFLYGLNEWNPDFL
jgi:tRNA A-37 threonylcarbamoyl transferase component Bud32